MVTDNNLIEVCESYKFSDGRIVAFLQSANGKLPNQTVLSDDNQRHWVIKQYFRTTGSIETYEKIEAEEAQNIFQYYLEGVNHQEKPIQGSKLRVI